MKPTVKVIVLENHFKDAAKAASGDQLLKALMTGGNVVQNHARLNIQKQKLVDTSNLLNSIEVQPDENAETKALVSIGTNVIYAAIHEFGGTIVPRTKAMLSWVSKSGERIFAKSVHIPARPYLRPAIDEHEPEIANAIGQALVDQINGALNGNA